jgi:hypothetical protein
MIELWIDGYSNSGTSIKTAPLKASLARLQQQYPDRGYDLVRHAGLWFIARGAF